MASRSSITKPVKHIRVNRHVCEWTLEGWSKYLNQKERSPLEEHLEIGELPWKLKLDCNLDSDRKPPSAGLRVMIELELEPVQSEMTVVCCSLLGQNNTCLYQGGVGKKSEAAANPRREILWHHDERKVIYMDIPVEDVLELDEIKLCIVLDIMQPPSRWDREHDLLAIERMTWLPREVLDPATTDTEIVVQDKVIPVHRSVLADSSPILESLVREARCTRLELAVFRLETVKELVEFMYTKREPNFQGMNASAIFDLLKAAEIYALEKLQKYAEDHIASRLDPENAIDFLVQASEIDNLSVKKMVLLYIKNNKQLFSKDKLCGLEDCLTELSLTE